ncbi:response regulator [Erythrobacter sp. SCSIO 43205]|uniref:response regulator n=1 Tax=Erythrobacter sp. SCSIO 43205 TaxID=2779361 RepID=UPI001CA93105|nr:response regulator [Erythrobacter sp. SCSIO 43205]UAB77618.1 response regulator [Erythrobacter sp. SCSIO 43205]
MGQRILIAEDEAILAYDLAETVEAAGYRVEGPHPGISDAMYAFQKEKPDLAILDVELSDGNVFSFARKLKAEDVPVIFHTGSLSQREITDRFPDAIVRIKPCPPTSILDAVGEALEAQ